MARSARSDSTASDATFDGEKYDEETSSPNTYSPYRDDSPATAVYPPSQYSRSARIKLADDDEEEEERLDEEEQVGLMQRNRQRSQVRRRRTGRQSELENSNITLHLSISHTLPQTTPRLLFNAWSLVAKVS